MPERPRAPLPGDPRPERLKVVAELGRPQSLPAGEEQFEAMGTGQDILVLGLGPEPGLLAELLPRDGVSFVECPEFEAQMPPEWGKAVPRAWQRLSPDKALAAVAAGRRVLVYRPNLRLFPSFWGPLRAAAQVASLGRGQAHEALREVWLPARENGLLVRELADAFGEEGFSVRLLAPEDLSKNLPRLLREATPALFLSLNFAGLDAHGEAFHLLEAAGAAVAVWCVDNPFHLLSGLRSGFWKKALLCVTDDSFTPRLMDLGARAVLHLPLAAWRGFGANVDAKIETNDDVAEAEGAPPVRDYGLAERLVFVGRSEFPDKAGFFAGITLPEDVWEAARERLDRGFRPDFAWWAERLGSLLWPGRQSREPGFGAEQCAREWRARCLAAGARETPFTVFGDAGWDALVPGLTDRREPVDYYGPLADIYAQAGAVLNVTSLLLPAGLTQRHFDVWAAGGFLLTDATPGLAIFPEELWREISFGRPDDIPGLFRKFKNSRTSRETLTAAWRELIFEKHTYRHRVRSVLDWLDLD
ncbi:hypothetical protein dsx2_2656 [Desulfovibrio sp. X2]|uniref:glycosyltransferase family protein n=1 Tax=Desulfovibrio sp. X2 TaxID=941449 RepID=UPI000358D91B|nr:glycosyltransferase [Desulfovibrio sp. X2]EPR42739.1 hypothetical protein dsx2_2656 [Desulfovibrio sp. X2]